MGKLLAAHFKDAYYVIGLYMVNGTTALNNRAVISVKPAPKNSLEALLSARGFTRAFVSTQHPSFDRKIPTLHFGKDKQSMNLYRSFDAVVLINGVRAAEYLEK